METKEMAVQTNTLPSLVGDDVQFSGRDIPRVLLLQDNSGPVKQKVASAGAWYSNELSESFGDELEIIPVRLTYGAVYFARKNVGEYSKGDLICKSEDGISSIHGDSCKQCPHGVCHMTWKDKKTPPECSSTIDLVGILRGRGIPLVLTFKVTTFSIGKQIGLNMRVRGASSVRLGVAMNGENYVPVIKGYNAIRPDEFKAASELRAQLIAQPASYAPDVENTAKTEEPEDADDML